MHGLASSHHAPASAAEHPAAAALPNDAAMAGDHHEVAGASTGPQPAADVAAPVGASCDDDCPRALVILCIAVLAAAAAMLIALVLLRRRRACLSTTDYARSAPASARTRLPPPDPVRELCSAGRSDSPGAPDGASTACPHVP